MSAEETAKVKELQYTFINHFWLGRREVRELYRAGEYLEALRMLVWVIGESPEAVQRELQPEIEKAEKLLTDVRELDAKGYVGTKLVRVREAYRLARMLVEDLNRKLSVVVDRRGYMEPEVYKPVDLKVIETVLDREEKE